MIRAAVLIALTTSILTTDAVIAQRADVCTALSSADGAIRAERVAAGTVIDLPGGRVSKPIPALCRVIGTLHPVPESTIGFQLWLPTEIAWTGRFQMVGNGGYSSSLALGPMADAVARGSAVIATDTGHQGDDPSFARGHPQAITDWGWRAVHETALAGKRLVERHYGRAPAHSYFNGCSTGGHQAMMEAQRFPQDFDGIVAGAPGSNRVRLNAAFLWQFLANHTRGDDDNPILTRADLTLLADHSLASCRSANGGNAGGLASDGWLNDPLACRPDPAALACRVGGPQACLSPAKITDARAMYAGATDPQTHRRATFPWLPGSEAGWHGYWADPANPRQPMRVNFWRDWAFDPSWNWWAFQYGRDLGTALDKLSPTIDATDPNLTAFRARGGKLLQITGCPIRSSHRSTRSPIVARCWRVPAQATAGIACSSRPAWGIAAAAPALPISMRRPKSNAG